MVTICSGIRGGAINAQGTMGSWAIYLSDSTFYNNTATTNGGGISIVNISAYISNCSILFLNQEISEQIFV